ncbi:pantoate--beta-alanine ligase [bacterium]|nr:pantoate--beta-alanine ligase [bacterium]
MILTKRASELTNYLRELKKQNPQLSIGFVPTMGALHNGHLSLIYESIRENDRTVCSIFVNPTQFGEKKDLETYPKPIEQDMQMLMDAGTDILFLPEVDEVYPPDYEHQTFDLNGLDLKIEGEMRPGHFQGVCNVLYRFFEIVEPTRAYFGQKDFQQTVVAKMLVDLMDTDLEIRVMPIAREDHGLAMSSRNRRLPDHARKSANFIYHGLLKIKETAPEIGLQAAIQNMKEDILKRDNAELEYLLAVNANTINEVQNLSDADEIVILTVVKYYDVRLLDNMYI